MRSPRQRHRERERRPPREDPRHDARDGGRPDAVADAAVIADEEIEVRRDGYRRQHDRGADVVARGGAPPRDDSSQRVSDRRRHTLMLTERVLRRVLFVILFATLGSLAAEFERALREGREGYTLKKCSAPPCDSRRWHSNVSKINPAIEIYGR